MSKAKCDHVNKKFKYKSVGVDMTDPKFKHWIECECGAKNFDEEFILHMVMQSN